MFGKVFAIHRRVSGERLQNARNHSAVIACPDVIPLDKQALSPLYFEGFTRRRRRVAGAFRCSVVTGREASLMMATFFTVRGAWYVLGFAILEIAAVGLAF
jgi:hypothetical protein